VPQSKITSTQRALVKEVKDLMSGVGLNPDELARLEDSAETHSPTKEGERSNLP
jgi:hypothetical protein